MLCHFPQQNLASVDREADPGLGVLVGGWCRVEGECSKMERNMRKSRSMEVSRPKDHGADIN